MIMTHAWFNGATLEDVLRKQLPVSKDSLHFPVY